MATAASRRVPMICSAVDRFRAMPTPLARPRSSHRIWTGSEGAGHTRFRQISDHGENVQAELVAYAAAAEPTVRTFTLRHTERNFVLIGDGGQTTEVGETVTTKVGFADHVLRCAAERPAVMGAAVMQWSR